MTSAFSFRTAEPLLSKKKNRNIAIHVLKADDAEAFIKMLDKKVQAYLAELSFTGKSGDVVFLHDDNGKIDGILCGISEAVSLYDLAPAVQKITSAFDAAALDDISFSLVKSDLNADSLALLCAGWALAGYTYDNFKLQNKGQPQLVFPAGIDKDYVFSLAEAIMLIRDLINTPSNHMGPDDLEGAARILGKTYDANIKVISDTALAKDFPLIYAVGDSSPRRPRLIDLTWGNAKHPKVTLVGKGVCFDTGGLDLKPSQFMALMKKDMGGAAHALGLARLIMGTDLPVRLRVLIPAVENAVSGVSFRPGDVFTSRKGLTVENTNTDAEGRLILADALTYACEDKPELVIDFATLTGSARAALGQDIPAMFSNNDDIANDVRDASFAAEDPVWPMPLWAPYKKLIESDIADLVNSAKIPGDLIYSALFLQSFLDDETDWVHLDCFAWQSSSKPGKPAGGSDTGMRAIYAYLQQRYARKNA